MGTRVYQIGGGIPATSGSQNFLRSLASLVTNDSTVTGATVKAALEALAAAIPSSSSNILNFSDVDGATVTDALNTLEFGVSPYLRKPAWPNAFDLEFEDGNADWASLGYTVINPTTGVVQTRSGPINPWSAAGPAAGTYWSSTVGSWLFTQAPPGIQLDFYRTIALAPGESYYMRCAGTYCLGPAVNGRFMEVGLYGASGALLDNNNRVYATVRDDTAANYLMLDTFRATGGVLAGRTVYMLGGHDVRGVYFESGTTHHAIVVDSANCEPKSLTLSGAPAAGTLTRFGFRNLFTVSGGAVPQLFGVDFIRKKTNSDWLIPA